MIELYRIYDRSDGFFELYQPVHVIDEIEFAPIQHAYGKEEFKKQYMLSEEEFQQLVQKPSLHGPTLFEQLKQP